MSEEIRPTNNSENFTLHDFLQFNGETLAERVEPFSKTLEEYSRQGWTLYSRELISSPGPRVQVRDPLTGKIQKMIMMGANDYLGLSHHPEVIQSVVKTVESVGVGMGGPPLLNGMSSAHRELESRLAKLKEQEDAMLFASGFQANLGWTFALLRSNDYVIYDELNHASFFDGLLTVKARRKVRSFSFRHNDIGDLKRHLEIAQSNRLENAQIFVVVEGVYSMDGDIAPLPEIYDLCKHYNASLIVDDAHGTGVIGDHGGGTSDYFKMSSKVDISLGTFSKSFGVTGGFIAGKKSVIDYLRFFSRSYLFSAHLPQAIVSAVIKGCDIIEKCPELRTKLHYNIQYMIKGLNNIGFNVESRTAIIPIRIPENIDLRIFNKLLHEHGLFANPIEYPAVSLDEQRIRLSLMATHTKQDLDEALSIIQAACKFVGINRTNLK